MQVPDRKASFIGSDGDAGSSNPAGGTGSRAKLRAAVRAAEEKRKQQELAKLQGLVVDLKSYAAERATQEDGKRVTDTAIAPVQASPELDTLEGERTRREVTTTARRKVSAAVATIRAQRAQPQAGSDDKSSEAGPSRDDDDMSLEELAHERQLLLRLGFSEEARELGIS